jgi:hypothetical protein
MKSTTFAMLMVAVLTAGIKAQTLPERTVPKDVKISLERSTCFGSCPDYKLTITADGTVTFEGREFVEVKRAKKSISQEKLFQLIAEFEKAKYFTLNDRYQSHSDGCVTVWTDSPTAVTSIAIGGKSKMITHYYGCEDEGMRIFPKALTELEAKIDEIVDSEEWVEPNR